MSLRIGEATRARIHAHLERAFPEEGCGVLLGRDNGAEREVEDVVELSNQREDDARHNRYLIAPEEFLAAEREARRREVDVIGFYHSHPDHPSAPSQFDLENAWPFYSYLIVSVRGGRVADARSWRLADDRSRFDPEDVEMLERQGDPRP